MRLLEAFDATPKNIADLLFTFFQVQHEEKPPDIIKRYLSMIVLRLFSLGFMKNKIKEIVSAVQGAGTEKDIQKIIAKYKLTGTYSKTFDMTESSLMTALHEVEEEMDDSFDGDVEEIVKKFKIIFQIPFTTNATKEQKLRRLKYDLGLRDIDIESIQPISVADLAGSGEQAVIDYQVIVYISTILTRNEIEHEFEPEYKIAKMERLDKETEDDSE